MRHFLKKLYQKLRFIWFKDVHIESVELCGVSLKVTKGSVRRRVDQDDAWFYYLAKNNDIIFDIGANVGYTALLAMIQNENRRYVLVDPNPTALADAANNLFMNGLGNNASFFTSFVADRKDDKMKFYTVGTGAAGSMYKSHSETAGKLDSWIYVNTTTLDDLINYYSIVPDLIKIDVEGAEILVLNGAVKIVKKTQPVIMVEMHSSEDLPMKRNVEKILSWCKGVDYKAWYLKEGLELKDSEYIKHRGKCHLLLQPTSRIYPSYLEKIKQSAPLPKKVS